MNEIEFTKEEGKKLIKLLSQQVERANEGSKLTMVVQDHDISIQIKWGVLSLTAVFIAQAMDHTRLCFKL